MKTTFALTAFIMCTFISHAQQEQQKQDLDTIVVASTRINLPFKENSRTINIISAEAIKNSAANNIADLLQQVAGIDVRRRGTGGSQADLYIRGGSFDQTLLLIDGVKMNDVQTGHHTMNAALPIEVIERIEIIKGPAARIFGQNAFNGAINIVTKKELNNTVSVKAETGSFGQLNAGVTIATDLENSSHIVHVDKMSSAGYRYNTDYDNSNFFVKSVFNKDKKAVEMIATFQERKFGANGFYARESGTDQYEETQNSLIAFSTQFKTENLTIKPRIYWKRNQDEYVYLRNDPTVYRNLHISNKIGAEVNGSYRSKAGITGFGIDMSEDFITSNNLGDRDRFMTTLFLEHKFKVLDDKLDITPGVAVTYFSDFDFYAFPGLDVGYKISDAVKAYGNIGYTYRIPTYTDLFYNDPSTAGNPDLEVEEAFAQEIGIKYFSPRFSGSVAIYNRDAQNLIDFIRPNTAETVYTATNITDVNTKGVEVDAAYNFKLNTFNQTLAVGYNFLEDDILNQNKELSRYSLNTLKHHFSTRLSTQLFKNVSQNIIYKHAQRTTGDSYNVWDASLVVNVKQLEFTVTASNIFNADYIEAGFVPMPPSNILFGMRYSLN
jgi:iron complex outermembrane receptor protein